MTDPLDTVTNPSRFTFPIEPDDVAEVSPVPKAVYCGSEGTIVLRSIDGLEDCPIPVVKGQLLPIRARFVRSTGTDVDPIFGLA